MIIITGHYYMLPFILRIEILERNHCSLTLSLECSSDNSRRCRACSQNRSRSLPVKHFGGSTCSHVTKQPPIFIRLITFSNPYTTTHNIRCILTKLALNPFSPSLSVSFSKHISSLSSLQTIHRPCSVNHMTILNHFTC